jgi:type IV secretory pathway TrbL component
MSKLLKKISKGVKKVFKGITKVVKKIAKSKVFKAIVIAAAVYFTAGAAAGFLGTSGVGFTAGGGMAGLKAGIVSSASALTGGAGAIASNIAGNFGMGSMAAGKVATVAGPHMVGQAGMSILSSGAPATVTGVGGTVAGMSAAKATLLASGLSTGGAMVSGYATGRANEKAFERDEADREINNQTQLGIRERLGKYENMGQQSYAQATPKPGGNTAQYYNSSTDSYSGVGA